MLYEIFSNRTAVNLLKVLYDNEKINNRYSLPLKDAMQKLNLLIQPAGSIDVLKNHDLIISDHHESDMILGITEKGKKFIDILDQMSMLISPKMEKKANVTIHYDLTDLEKKILIVLFKMERESGNLVRISSLTQELFPYEDYFRKKSTVSKQVSKLEEMHLIEKVRQRSQVFLKITDSGMRVINEQIINNA